MSELVKIIGNDGLTQIFFVTNSRFTKEEIDVYQLLESVIFDDQVSKHTTIIKTKFPEFENEAKCEEDRQKFHSENPELARIFNTNKIIYINNPPLVGRPASVELNKEIREESRKRLLTYLGKFQNTYQPGNLNTLKQRINSYKTQKENLQSQISSLYSQINSAESSHWNQIQALESKHQREIQTLEENRQNELNKIRKNSLYGYIDNGREYYTIEYAWNRGSRLDSIMKNNFHSSLQSMDIPLRYYEYRDAKNKLDQILEKLGRYYGWIHINSGNESYEWDGRTWYYQTMSNSEADESKLFNFLNNRLDSYDYERGLHVKLYSWSSNNFDYPTTVAMEFQIGTREHPKSEYVNLEKALAERNEANEQEITRQIERIKQENRNQKNRLWQEMENKKRLNAQRISQEKQNIQANLDSVKQTSQERISYAQQQISDAERNLEQQVQQQVNLPGIVSLTGMIAKMLIKN